jgi:hypothetical protein
MLAPECMLAAAIQQASSIVEGRAMDEVKDHRAKGGIARAEALTPEQRTEIARGAALARWNGDILRATHSGELTIGEMVIPCSVLEDGTRVLSETGFASALGRARSGSAWLPGADPGARMPHYAPPKSLISFLGEDLAKELLHPIKYRSAKGGKIGYGVDARLIPRICNAWLSARDSGKLSEAQRKTAEKADALIRGLAEVGIVALVDEATGYQDVRDRQALQAILDKFLRRELAAWAKRFPDDFYGEMFRLRQWKRRSISRRPGIVAEYTKDLVYRRLAPDLLKELEARNPKDDKGKRRAKHHQWLTEDIGHPALARHLHAVITLMRACDTWHQFKTMIDRSLPRLTRLDDLPLFSSAAEQSNGS